jgi:uncharacterized protein
MMLLNVFKSILVFLYIVSATSLAFGQADLARKELAKRKIPYTIDALGERAAIGDDKTVDLFLTAGMDPNARNREGRTPLLLAAMGGHDDIVDTLLRYGAEANMESHHGGLEQGKTPLMFAAQYGHETIVESLLKYDAQVSETTAYGKTALMFAAESGYLAIVKTLLALGEDVHADTMHGWTALLLAASEGRPAVVDVLLQNGAKINDRSGGGKTPLMLAAEKDHAETVRVLIGRGASLNARLYGKTALAMATVNGYHQTAQLLEKAGAKE